MIDEEFPRWLASLAEIAPAKGREQWQALLRSEAWRQQDALASAAPYTAFAGRGEGTGRMDVSRALVFFRAALNKIISPPNSEDAPNNEEERTVA
ncbi:hypothetical protein [Actinomyces ruminis]|uniref:hypothetical protein n=1 Tax=Actinomyces ruminis TaxID=1937003 RepID=UPI00211F3465|nr:hypothetical protein [Actinomyces ruminis]